MANKKNGQEAGWFLGSIHVTPRHIIDQINSSVLKAFNNSDVLGVERDVTRELIKKDYLYEFNKRIFDISILKPELLKVVFDHLKISLDESDPEFVKNAVAEIYKKINIVEEIDMAFINKAKKREMPIIELDCVELRKKQLEQADLKPIQSSTPDEVWRFIQEIAMEVNEAASTIETGVMTKFYMSEEVVIERNRKMVESTHEQILKGKKPFSIAGYEHFIGEEGMDELMRKKGYDVRQVFVDEPLTNEQAV